MMHCRSAIGQPSSSAAVDQFFTSFLGIHQESVSYLSICVSFFFYEGDYIIRADDGVALMGREVWELKKKVRTLSHTCRRRQQGFSGVGFVLEKVGTCETTSCRTCYDSSAVAISCRGWCFPQDASPSLRSLRICIFHTCAWKCSLTLEMTFHRTSLALRFGLFMYRVELIMEPQNL